MAKDRTGATGADGIRDIEQADGTWRGVLGIALAAAAGTAQPPWDDSPEPGVHRLLKGLWCAWRESSRPAHARFPVRLWFEATRLRMADVCGGASQARLSIRPPPVRQRGLETRATQY